MTAAIVGLLVVLALIVELIAGNIESAMAGAPAYQARFEQLLTDLNGMLASSFGRADVLSLTSVMQQIDLRALAGTFATAMQSVVASTFTIAIYVVFVLLEHRTLDRKLSAMFPNAERQQSLRATLREIGSRIEAYVLIKTLISFLMAVATFAVLAIAGADFAAFQAFLVFLLNFIPYVGAAIGIVLPALLALLQFGSPTLFVVIASALLLAHVVLGNILEPHMMGRSLNLSPLLMIVSLAAWGAMWGVTGMLLSIPLMVIVMIVLSQFPRTRPIAIFMSENGEIG
jgi:predicted PurR-regulated permease PerM